jgi:hypothetical protein
MWEETINILRNPEAVEAFIDEHGAEMLAKQYLATVTTAEELVANYEKIIALQTRELRYFKRKYPHPYEDELENENE